MTFDPADPIGSVFSKIIGKLVWQVRQGHGSFLTLEFGNPHLEVREALPNATSVGLRDRRVTVRGDWHLWIYCCDWKILQGGARLAHSESDRQAIERALLRIDSQTLNAVDVDPPTGSSCFSFEHRLVLETSPYQSGSDDTWLIYGPDRNVLTFRADGCYSWHADNTPPSQAIWLPVPTASR